MNPNKQEITALITPVTAEVQDEARALASEGRETKALSRLRKASGPGLLEARAALAVLESGRTLPVDYPQALENLRSLAPDLTAEMTALLAAGDQTAAIKLLRDRTDIDLAGGYHRTQELAARQA
ncbi:hypothetical protein ACFXKR_08840 [Streptomyces violascens]|uniref:hypothetical protein n=1 Tax=Streptomyces violascens TaxID=67381 RepID=UPI0036A02475